MMASFSLQAVALALGLANAPSVALPPLDGDPPVAAPWEAGALERLPEVLNILYSNPTDSHGRSLALAHLVAQGPRAVPAMFALLVGTAPVSEERLAQGPVMTPARRKMLLDAMRSWDSERVAQELAEALQINPSTTFSIAAMQVLGEVGDARSLDTFLAIVGSTDPAALRHPAVRRPTVRALTETLQRDSLCYVVLTSMLRDLSNEELGIVLEAIAAAGDVEGVEILEALLGRAPEHDALILEAFASLGIRERALTRATLRTAAVSYLEAADPNARRAAALLVGSLRDPSLFDALVDLLEDREQAVAAEALDALRSMAGTVWPAEAERWSRWFARETTWLERDLPQLVDQLESAEPEASYSALRSLREHPLFGERVVEVVAPAVQHRDRGVAAMACETLGQVRHPDGLAPLIEALFDPRQRVREAAGDSLRSLTGVDLPDDGAAWQRWFEGSRD